MYAFPYSFSLSWQSELYWSLLNSNGSVWDETHRGALSLSPRSNYKTNGPALPLGFQFNSKLDSSERHLQAVYHGELSPLASDIQSLPLDNVQHLCHFQIRMILETKGADEQVNANHTGVDGSLLVKSIVTTTGDPATVRREIPLVTWPYEPWILGFGNSKESATVSVRPCAGSFVLTAAFSCSQCLFQLQQWHWQHWHWTNQRDMIYWVFVLHCRLSWIYHIIWCRLMTNDEIQWLNEELYV